MPGIITPSFPLAGSITPSWTAGPCDLLEEELPSLDRNSTRAVLFTLFVVVVFVLVLAADFFAFAIFWLLPYWTVGCMQTDYVLVSGELFANACA
jgi:hypothetical protein